MAEVVKFLTTEDNLEVNMIIADPLSATAAGTKRKMSAGFSVLTNAHAPDCKIGA